MDTVEQNRLWLKMVTPEGVFLESNVDMVEFPSGEGYLGILPGHCLLFTSLMAGELRVMRNQITECYAVAGGFVEIYPGHILVVATFASAGEEEEVIELACEKARGALETAATEDPSIIEVELRDLRLELANLAHRKLEARK